MKMSFPSFFALILFVSFAQLANSQSVDSALNFFPMHKGDYWLYDWNRYQIARYYVFTEITGDTVMPNGQRYFTFAQAKLSQPPVPSFYKRVDSSTACVFQWIPQLHTEYMVDSLRARKTDFFMNPFVGERYCVSVEPDTVLGIPTLTKSFHYIAYNMPQDQFAYGFGLSFTYSDDTLYGTYQTLVYAKINGIQYGTPQSVEKNSPEPQQYQLFQNFPNPFNPTTTISFSVPRESYISIRVIDILGRTVSDIAVGRKSAGLHYVDWTAGVSTGVYFYQLRAQPVSQPSNTIMQTRKMLLLK